MFPHERSLVKRLESEPFALLGVNSDQDLQAAKKQNEEQRITWRSFYDKSTSGPIASAWNIHGWPTIYVVDHKGVIRYKNVRGEQMDEAVDKLLEELKKEKS